MTAIQTKPDGQEGEGSQNNRIVRKIRIRKRARSTEAEGTAATGQRFQLARPGQTRAERLIDYEYQAVDTKGRLVAGKLLTGSEEDALQRIRLLGLRPVVLEQSRSSLLNSDIRIPGFGPKVDGSEVAVLSRQFATMVGAGVPLLRSLTVLIQQTENEFLAQTLRSVRTDVESGDSLSDALGRHPRVFDDIYVPMVRAGETAGALDEVLAQLATTLERSVALRQKIRSAMFYPVAVLCLVAIVVSAMLFFVVPVFAGIYDDLGGSLPLPTRVLVGISEALSTKLPFTLLFIGSITFAVRARLATEAGRLHWDKIKLRLPLVGDLIHKAAIARLTRILSVLSRSGVPILDALTIGSDTVGNVALQHSVRTIRQEVRRGESIGRQMGDDPLFPAMVTQLVSIGEETGTLDSMLETVANSFEEEVESAVAGFAALMEPLLMAFIGIVVGGMVVSLYLPMFRIVDLVQ